MVNCSRLDRGIVIALSSKEREALLRAIGTKQGGLLYEPLREYLEGMPFEEIKCEHRDVSISNAFVSRSCIACEGRGRVNGGYCKECDGLGTRSNFEPITFCKKCLSHL